MVLHAELGRLPAVRDAVLDAAARAAAAGEHKHLVRTLGSGAEADRVWVVTESQDGNCLRDLLERKRQSGGGGLPARGAGNLVVGVAAAIAAGGVHGGLSTESIIVSRNGRVRVGDLALGAGVAAAVAAGALPAPSSLAPEVARGAAPDETADVYALGALLYEALVGRPLERGGPRPSEAVAGLTTTIDEIIARTCAADPARRFGSVEVVKELVADALGRGAAVEDDAAASAHGAPQAMPSLSGQIAAQAAPGAAIGGGGGGGALDPVLAAALADSTEKWLITKGRLDYGPFSLQQVLDQIETGQIVAGNIIVDKDTGARTDVGAHPLLAPMVDAARQRLDDARRAHAEDAHQTKEKKRGVLLFAGLAAVVLALGAVLYLILGRDHAEKKPDEVAGVAKLGGASLDVKISEPKKPAPVKRSGGSRSGGKRSSSGGGGDDDEMLALDLSGDDDATETLDMGTIFGVYSRYGGQLGGCLSKTGAGYASISIIIEGKSGKVNWVRVNGQKGGGLYDCINRVMRSMKFPSVNGPRSRAEFDISR
ncbi:MAG: protein kinase [Kofleriaceae bacterium]|nr:protein kinase [Kofleriaceae bacterium]